MCSPGAGRWLLPLLPLLPSLLPLLLLLVVAPSVSPTAVAASSAQQNHRMRSDWSLHDAEYVLAYINVTYGDPASGAVYQQGGEIGKFSTGLVASARGRLVHVTSRNGTAHHGCDQRWENAPAPGPHQQPWVALIRRGLCNFDVKVENAYHNNASAVIIYDYKEGELHQIQLAKRHHDTIVTVFIPKTQGEDLAHITDSGVEVAMQITPGKRFRYADTNLNKTSVLFVSVSFILLMVISLAWLLFYYVQRFRYMHARDQLTKRLVCAAKKAVCRIPVRALKAGDPQLADGECCAVCLEPYRVSDQLRSLPCSHEYHKQCIDPWLLKNRTCPMCKMDILKYFGLSSVSEESIVHLELEAVAVAQGGGAPLSPVLYVTSQPSAASVAAAARAARSRSVSRSSLQSMSLVIPSPACVESLYTRGVTGGAVRSRRVSAAPSIGRRREPPRRASAPVPPASEDAGRDALARSLSTPVGPAVSFDPAAGETVVISPAAEVVAPASLVLNAVQTAMHRRCQRSARTDTDSARPETTQHGPDDSCDGDTATPEPPTEPESAEPVPSETPERQPPTEATSADCDSGAASEEMQKHSDAVIQMEDVDADDSE